MVISATGFAHDFYVSVTNGHYNAETQMMECSMKVTAHDMENAIRLAFAKAFDLDDESKTNAHHQLLEKYISSKINIWIDGKFVDLEYLGFELELSDDLWIYFQFKAPDQHFKYENKILTEQFSLQQNITHFKLAEDCDKSFVFTKNESPEIFKCDE